MVRRVSNDPYGYKKLLVYTKAEQMQGACAAYTRTFPREKTLVALADQMDRSARSVKQNIIEGWKRNGTAEYHQFLGFSLGANAELEEDCNDIIKGIYKGIKGEEKGIEWVESLRFYPLSPHYSPLVQLKLRCKELNFLLQKLQKSLTEKMTDDQRIIQPDRREEDWLAREIAAQGYIRLADGRIVAKSEV